MQFHMLISRAFVCVWHCQCQLPIAKGAACKRGLFTLMNASVCASVSAQLWHLNSFAFRLHIYNRLYISVRGCHVHLPFSPTPAHSNRLWLFYCRAFAAIIKSSTLHCHQYIIYIVEKRRAKNAENIEIECSWDTFSKGWIKNGRGSILLID